MSIPRPRPVLIAAAVLALAAGCTRTVPLTPEAARAKGDAMLKQMSDRLASTQVFSFTADHAVERVRRGGEKVTDTFSRHTVIRRPNQLAFSQQGQDQDGAAWYDGRQFTAISNRAKVWVRGPMPPTLDEALDFVSAEYAVQIPTADLIYSNPYEALITPDTTGGWVNVEKVGDRSCDHLSYYQAVVDWQIWLTQGERPLPCQLQITYKTQPGQPVARVVFKDWNESPTVTETTFVPAVPEGFKRIRLMRYATVEDKSAGNEEGVSK